MLEVIISGGQTGVDIAGLIAGKASGLKTGGWMPKGFRRLDGNFPDMQIEFGMKEHESWNYKLRTYCNVRDGDATLRIAHNFYSPGEICTKKAISYYERPFLDLCITSLDTVDKVAEWIINGNFRVLNVAGNSEQTFSGIQKKSVTYLTAVFGLVAQNRGILKKI